MSVPEPHRIHCIETESTNKLARELSLDSPITLITAEHQTAGRGQRGNTWESETGKNLLFSLITHTSQVPASQQFVLCELISVAICDVLLHYTQDICIKWPNDIYYQDHKLCGILIEHDLEGAFLSRTIIGVGLNVNQSQFTGNAPNPISLLQVLGHEVEREVLLKEITTHFIGLYSQYSTHLLDRNTLHERYTHLLYRLGINAEYRDTQGPFTATLLDVALDGRLILEDLQGHQRDYLFKEVAYII